jgi:hypothetical protein
MPVTPMHRDLDGPLQYTFAGVTVMQPVALPVRTLMQFVPDPDTMVQPTGTLHE